MTDTLVVGGGVIGLSIAWELAQAGHRVHVVEREQPGREASWAGAGMLVPGPAWPPRADAVTPLANGTTHRPSSNGHGTSPSGQAVHGSQFDLDAQWRGASMALWPDWTHRLCELTGLDNGFRRCGAWELRRAATTDALNDEVARWLQEGVRCELADPRELSRRLPTLNPEVNCGYFLPDMAQVRNPRHLKCLLAACARAGVTLSTASPAIGWQSNGTRITGLDTLQGRLTAANFVIAAGAWTGQLLAPLQLSLPVEPIRGQIALLSQWPSPFEAILQVGRRYLVPRGDGRILVGATEERAGFDKQVTAGGISSLLDFAFELVPSLKQARLEQTWSGLRPYLPSGCPTVGRAGHWPNLYVATGHYRAGLQLSTITATLIRELLLGQELSIPAAIIQNIGLPQSAGSSAASGSSAVT